MRHNLDRFAEVGAFALLGDDGIVDFAGGDVVRFGGVDIQEALVVTEVKVGLSTVFGDIALAVLVRVERARVDVDVGVEFLNRHPEAAGLQKFCGRCRNDSFAE